MHDIEACAADELDERRGCLEETENLLAVKDVEIKILHHQTEVKSTRWTCPWNLEALIHIGGLQLNYVAAI